MAITFYTKKLGTPTSALSKLKQAIDKKEATTWKYVGDTFHYLPEQWRGAVKFKAALKEDSVTFLAQKGDLTGTKTYGDAYNYVHGRFLELLLGHAGPHGSIITQDTRK
ncbi:hypothetical protein [Herbaspirillum seropedicae]|uniref:hypothetical protein n=1 Tax=Herbaspirillum seropedicae TaxID=964 RepID=UPI003FCDC645